MKTPLKLQTKEWIIIIITMILMIMLDTLTNLIPDFLPNWYKKNPYIVLCSTFIVVVLILIFSRSRQTRPKKKGIQQKPFFGRKIEQEKIINLMNSEKVSILNIYGLGGVGKTTLIEKVIKDERVSFDEIIQLTAKKEFIDNNEMYERKPLESVTFDNLCRGIALKFGKLNEFKARKKDHQKLELIESILIENKSLIVVDNFETIDEDLKSFIKGMEEIIIGTASKALLTCRYKIDNINSLLLQGLSLDETKKLLNSELEFEYPKGLPENQVTKIHDATKGLPLAIKLIASRIKTSDRALIDKILERFSNIDFNNQNEIYEKCYKFIFQHIWKDLSKSGKTLLIKLATYSINDKIDIDHLESIFFDLEIPDSVEKRNEFLSAFSELIKHALLETKVKTTEDTFFSIHPFTRTFVIADLLQRKDKN